MPGDGPMFEVVFLKTQNTLLIQDFVCMYSIWVHSFIHVNVGEGPSPVVDVIIH